MKIVFLRLKKECSIISRSSKYHFYQTQPISYGLHGEISFRKIRVGPGGCRRRQGNGGVPAAHANQRAVSVRSRRLAGPAA